MRYLLLLFVLCASWTVTAQRTEDWLQKAQASQDPAVAAAAYDSLRLEGKVSTGLYLSQGNAYFQAGDLGRAILAYERGLRLRPGNADLANNLAFVEEKLSQQLRDLPSFFLLRWWRLLGSWIGTTTSHLLALICWWLAVGIFILWFFRRERLSDRRRFVLLPAAGAAFLLAVFFYALGESRMAELNRTDQAVLVAPTAELRVAPGENATLEKMVSAGLRLRIVDRFKDNFVKVELRDGKQGWLPVEAIEVI